MNKQVKKLWMDALKSGKYEQGKGRLRRNMLGAQDRYCCLGVLCDLSISHQNTSSCWGWVEGTCERSVVFTFNDEGKGVGGLPPREVLEWAGVTQGDAALLSAINDERTNSFVEVVKIIEEDL